MFLPTTRNGFRRHGGGSLLLVLLTNTKSSIYGDLGAKPLLSVLVAVNA